MKRHRAKMNLYLDMLIGVAFLVELVSGVVLALVLPHGGYQGGRNPGWDPNFLFSRITWDLIHTWSGVVMIVVAVVHFWIHWRWVRNVTRKLILSLLPRPQSDSAPAMNQGLLQE